MTDLVVEVDGTTFEEVVLAGSRTRPVIVDFWASWCGPCRVLGPILERLATEYDGRFLLAKIDSDRNSDLARAFGVRGIPSVKAFVDGRVADEFTGALPERAVREFIDRIVPSLAEPMRMQAATLRARGELDRALGELDAALEVDPGHEASALDRAELLIELGRIDEARSAVGSIRDGASDQLRVAQIDARLSFAAAPDDVGVLERRLAADPDDSAARRDLVNALASAGDYARALDAALELVRRDRGFDDDAGRRAMLRIFDLLGPDSDLARRYRRELASLINR